MPSTQKQIIHPGIHGGKWYIDKHGMVQYGEPPVGHVPHPSMDEHHQPGVHHALAQVLSNIQVPEEPKEYVGFQNAYWYLSSKVHELTSAESTLSTDHKIQLTQQFHKVHNDWSETLNKLGPAELKQISKFVKVDGYQWGNKQTLYSVLLNSSPEMAKQGADVLKGKKAAHYEKWGGKSGYEKTQAVKQGKKLASDMKLPGLQPPQPTNQPVVPAEITIGGSPDEEEEEHFDTIGGEGPPGGLVFLKDGAHLGGAHTKSIWQDNSSKQWLFKPHKEEFRGFADALAAQVAQKMVGTQTPKVFQVELKGKKGSVQELIDGHAGTLQGKLPQTLAPQQLEDLGREQVLDWLIGNHDAHAGNFLITKEGRVVGIDKGQAFKFLGQDKLDPNFQPNASYGSVTYYKAMWDAWKDKKLPQETVIAGVKKAIENVEKVSDADYKAMLQPYMDSRFGAKANAKKEEAYKLAIQRKNGLRKDFEKMLSTLTGQPFEFPAKLAPSMPSVTGAFSPQNTAALQSAALGPHGCSIDIDSTHIEDQNVLVYSEREAGTGKPQTALSMKLTPQANDILLGKLKEAGVENLPPQAEKVHVKGQALPEDKQWPQILSAIKTINHHSEDKAYNQSALKELEEARTSLTKLQADPEQPPNVQEMAKQYLAVIADIDSAKNSGGKTQKHGQYMASSNWSPKQEKEEEKPEKGAKLKVSYSGPMRFFGGGITPEGHVTFDPTASKHKSWMQFNSTKQYEADLGDGVSLTFRPYTTAATTYAHSEDGYAAKGGVELRVSGKPVSEESAALALKKLGELGIKTHESQPEDAELLYLHQYAYARGLTTADAYPLKKPEDWEAPGAMNKVKKYLNDTLGEDVTKSKGYNPAGYYESAKGDAIGGRKRFERPDVTDEVLTTGKLKDVSLIHNTSANIPELIESVLSTGGHFMPTTEKLRIGIQPKGMSPTSDMQTGGASYFFTRLRKKGTTTGTFVFNNKLLKRMDAIHYNSDHFGKVTSEKYVTGNRAKSIDTIRDIAHNGASNNETIFKEGVSLIEHCEKIRCHSASERNAVLAIFAKHGVTHVGGLPVEKVVQSPKGKNY